jgi:hypothetical protein
MKNSLLVFSILLLAACNASLPQTQTAEPTQPVISTLELSQGQVNLPKTEADVPRVAVKDAKSAIDSGTAIVVDVRTTDAFAKQHVTGALSIPLADIEANPSAVKLDKNKWIITYCT